jgi:hypothetical protein
MREYRDRTEVLDTSEYSFSELPERAAVAAAGP